MNFSRLALMVLAAGVVALGCQADSGSLPSDPAAVELAANEDAEIKKSILAACSGRDRGTAISMYQHAVNDWRKGDTASAQARAIELTVFITTECDGEADAKATAITQIMQRFDILEPDESIDPGALGPDGGFGICTADQECTVATLNGFGVVEWPVGFCHAICTVSFTPFEDSFDPFSLATGGEVESFPKRFDIQVTGPHGPTEPEPESLTLAGHDETLHATVWLCVVESEVEEAGVDFDDLRIGRLEGTTVETLDLIEEGQPEELVENCEPPPGPELLGLNRAVHRLYRPISDFLVKPLYASPGGLGGAVINFSPFAAIEGDEGPTPEPIE